MSRSKVDRSDRLFVQNFSEVISHSDIPCRLDVLMQDLSRADGQTLAAFQS